MYGQRYSPRNSGITRAMARERQSGYVSMPPAYTLTLTDGSAVTGVVDLGRRWAGKEDFRSYYNALSAQQWATATVFISGHGDVAIRDICKVD